MDCPVCKGVKLVMSERLGIEIDYCPQCRGVWLDRGELDKIIERSAQAEPAASSPRMQHHSPAPSSSHEEKPHWRHHDDDRRRYQEDEHRYREEGYHKKRRSGFLGDLFDFD